MFGLHKQILVKMTYKSIAVVASVLVLFAVSTAQAQDSTSIGQHIEKAASQTGKAIGKGAKAVGNKTAELASKGESGVVDKIYSGKVGPNGETIFINNKAKYYRIDKKGHRHYLNKSQLKNKL